MATINRFSEVRQQSRWAKKENVLHAQSNDSCIDAIKNYKIRPPQTTRVGRALRIACSAVALLTGGLVLNILQILTLPINIFSPSLSHRLNSIVALFAWTITDYFFNGQDNVYFTVSGLEQAPPSLESAFVICNHVFFGDFFLIHSMARKLQMMKYCRYFLKDSIKYIPIFGWAMYLANMPFLKRNWQRDSDKIKSSLKTLTKNKLPVYLVSHIEGHRFNEEKKVKSQEYAQANGLPILNNLLLPRCKGFYFTVQALRGSHIKHIYDLTIAYFNVKRGFAVAPSMWDVLSGNLTDYRFHLHFSRINMEKVPLNEAECNRWLYELYSQKDLLMEDIKNAFQSKYTME